MPKIKRGPGRPKLCAVCRKELATVKGFCRTCYNAEYHKANYIKHRKVNDLHEAISAALAEGSMSQSEIARQFGVSRQYVSQVKFSDAERAGNK